MLNLYKYSGAEYECIKPNIEITVSPVSKKLQVIWEIEEKLYSDGDWIGLYGGEISIEDPKKNCKYKFKIKEPTGRAISNIKFNEKIKKNFKEPVILKWQAIYWTNKNHEKERALVTTSLSTFPNWMGYYWDTVKDKPINNIFLPGTHNSACNEKIRIKISTGTGKSNSFKNVLRKSKSGAVQIAASFGPVNKLSMTQDTSIMDQLLLGIRYLDIRVILNGDGKYWVGHGAIKVIKMEDVVEKVIEFAEGTDREVVIFDLHQFINFETDGDHEMFIKYLKDILTVNEVQRWIPPTDKLWKTNLLELLANPNGAKIIISYNYHKMVTIYGKNILWYPVKQLWADKNFINELLEYFKDIFSGYQLPTDICHAAMAQLTPQMNSPGKIFGNIIKPLNVQAEKNADAIYNLFMNSEIGLKTNILATDYFMGMGTVRQAFIWNRRKFQKDKRNLHCDPEEAYQDKYYQNNISE